MQRTACEQTSAIDVTQLWGDSIVHIARVPGPVLTIGDLQKRGFLAPEDSLPDDELPRLEPGKRVVVQFANLTFVLRHAAPTRPLPANLLERFDPLFYGVFGAVLCSFAGGALALWMLTLLNLLLPQAESDFSRAGDLAAVMILAPLKAAELPPAPKAAGNPDAGAGRKVRGEEGRRGSDRGTVKEARGGAIKTRTDQEQVDDAGVLGAFSRQKVDLNAIFGRGSFAGGVTKNLGALVGPRGADQRGTGFGLRGDKKGGGGESLGPGGLATKGRGTGKDGYGAEAGSPCPPGKTCEKGDSSIGIADEPIVCIGSLDPALIDAVVKRHIEQIQWCYERELHAKPGLGGKLVVNFTIEADGLVSQSRMKSSSMGDASVEECVTDRFHKLRFPKPRGGVGSTVTVNYPLLFKTSGG